MELIKDTIVTVVVGLFFVLTIYINLNTLYYVILGFFGFGKAKRDYEITEDKTRFLILVAAHNEEKVIASTIENLRQIDYNPELFDVYIVNDNSIDRTGAICEEMGQKYVDTSKKLFEREGVGKPAGLQYALRELGFEKLVDKYDCLMILDADNHVDPTILKELNSQYVAKGEPEAIQAYLDSKNSATNLSLGYAVSYYLVNRFFQLAKYRLGLINSIGGTGFIVKMSYLMKHGGFRFKSLTEDIELEMEIVKDNGRVLWNHFVRVYDEKPDNFKVSIKQRTRWSQGHWYVAFTNFKPMVKLFFKEKRKIKILDQLLYLFGMARAVQLTLTLAGIVIIYGYGFVTNRLHDFSTTGNQLIDMIFGVSFLSLFMFIYQFGVLMFYAIKMDTKQKYSFLRMTWATLFYAYTYIYAQLVGLLKWRQQHTWVKTEHNKTAVDHNRETA
ncbi:glycosyltransferase family 2 protein [Ectobacillus ponti]|uniref:Glycosyltransferase family 2 protein n=1 Tax=Ectobacillus ponti TaxID=2961894 RepID=A0AA41X7Y2_9BACI|nr:glycosyltransferase [Ectobacillus ponti]MCP8967995.1 glycosyltransferase family 2 protein [Ectobacillus ponti]